MKKLIPLAISLSIAAPVSASKVYACEDANGQRHFQQTACSPGNEQLDYTDNYRSASGGFDGGAGYRPMTNNERFIQSEQQRQQQRSYNRRMDQLTNSATGADTRLDPYTRDNRRRELTIQRRELQRDLDRVNQYGLGSYGKARAIEQQLRDNAEAVRDLDR